MVQIVAMVDGWYEVIWVLHLMAMICLLQANSLLVASEGWETII